MSDIPGGDKGGARPVAGMDDATSRPTWRPPPPAFCAGPMAGMDDAPEARRVQIKVNGMIIEVTEGVGVREVLAKAKRAGAIEGVIEEYVVERVEEEGELGLEETITVTELEEFLAVPTGKTDVA